MAEAVRRFESRSNPDVVRRLIARPIRLEHSLLRPERALPAAESEADEEGRAAGLAETIEIVGPDLGLAIDIDAEGDEFDDADGDVESLEAQVTLLKAVLQAEREESAQLRARLADPSEGAAAEVRAMRDRWASLVDQLLRARR